MAMSISKQKRDYFCFVRFKVGMASRARARLLAPRARSHVKHRARLRGNHRVQYRYDPRARPRNYAE